ncbi:MAG: putative Ig domain-containing protein [Gammaproteobacteria bacterium]|nr:putative Ig domain-containing protein [Gammaproteobacteria bacterium]
MTYSTTTTQRRLLAVFALALLAGGCLSKSDSESGNKPDGNVAGQGNSAPSIQGNPATAVMVGDNYSFTPSANDPDGDPLTFAVSNLPRWASFDTGSGRLSGQPLLGDEGVYTGIGISVTDGQTTNSLPGFSIEVTQAALGSMTLSWTPPTQNEDGTALTDLAGYKFYLGKSPGNYGSPIRVDNPGITSYVVENLLPDTYYVVATSFNTSGIESAYSNMAIKTVAAP